MADYDALLLVSFGGPEGPDDVLPFLENVVQGKNVPAERLLEVAEHYAHFEGVSPLNGQLRALLVALVAELNARGPHLAVYWGNRNWHPMLPEVVQQMADDGVTRALAFVTSAFGSYPSCRQYLEDIEQARQAVRDGAPQIDKLRLFYNHPSFIEANADRVWDALESIPADRRTAASLIFTAHSIPESMARTCAYESQLRETCGLVVQRLGGGGQDGSSGRPWHLVYQNRSGPPAQAWLGPDIRDFLRGLATEGVRDVVIAPIGFVCEHMEIAYDLDVEVAGLCDELGIAMTRAGVAGRHPKFVEMIRDLILERTEGQPPKATGSQGPWPNECPADCCSTR